MNSKSFFSDVNIPNDDVLTNCMHCGLCLPTCPTYSLTGNERSSPRGRIRLIKSVAEGTLEITPRFVDEMNFCLDCQACETACPAGVKYGSLVEAARSQIFQQGKESFKENILKKIFLTRILSHKRLLKFVSRVLRIYQQHGFEWFMNVSGLIHFFTPKLAKIQKLSPRIDIKFFDESHPEIISPKEKPKYRVGFLSGCIMNVAYTGVHDDTVQVLLHNNCEVVIPKNQECCGSLQAHNGDIETARRLAKHNIDVFLQYDLDAIVMNSAGCGALMKEYGHYLEHDAEYAEKAKLFSSKVKDLTEFLFSIEYIKPEQEFLHRVAYHDACHLIHAQKISAEPRALLKSIPGIDLVELHEASWCCGSAGIYNVTHYEDSMKLLERKMSNVKETKAEYIVAGNPGCMGQMEYGCSLFNVKTEIVHFATLLRKAYRI